MRKQNGFTIIELMIVVTIVGALATIAIPSFMEMQLRAKLAEIPSSVDGIKTAEIAYNAAYDLLVKQSNFIPSESVSKRQVEWTAGTNFDTLGWAPDGKVRGAYKIDVTGVVFTAFGISDIDGDGVKATFTAIRDTNVTAVTSSLIY